LELLEFLTKPKSSTKNKKLQEEGVKQHQYDISFENIINLKIDYSQIESEDLNERKKNDYALKNKISSANQDLNDLNDLNELDLNPKQLQSQDLSKRNTFKLTNVSSTNLTDSIDKKLNSLNFTDAINENKNHEFKIVVNNNENITFRNQKSNRNKNNNEEQKEIPEEDEFIFHDVNIHNTADRNKELIEQIGELKNSVYSYKDFN